MADDVRQTQHTTEAGFSGSSEEVRETQHTTEVGFTLDEHPGDCRETQETVEPGFSASNKAARETQIVVEAGFNYGAPVANWVRETQHVVEVGFGIVYEQVAVGCPVVQGEHAGAEAIQGGVC